MGGGGLMEKEIDIGTFFVPMREQPVFRKIGLFEWERHPVAEELSRTGMYLPSSSGLKEEEIRCVCDQL